MTYNNYRPTKRPDYSPEELKAEGDGSSFFGGEITNRTDIKWPISRSEEGVYSNNTEEAFSWLPAGENSDESKSVEQKLGANPDIDAVWPAGVPLRGRKINYIYTGTIPLPLPHFTPFYTDGAFKIGGLNNAEIHKSKAGYTLSGYKKFIPEKELSKEGAYWDEDKVYHPGWALPNSFKRKP